MPKGDDPETEAEPLTCLHTRQTRPTAVGGQSAAVLFCHPGVCWDRCRWRSGAVNLALVKAPLFQEEPSLMQADSGRLPVASAEERSPGPTTQDDAAEARKPSLRAAPYMYHRRSGCIASLKTPKKYVWMAGETPLLRPWS
ncbi:hypothetical protein GN956_G4519 [Arapaima gigas]